MDTEVRTQKNYCAIILSARQSHLVIQMCKETQLEQMYVKLGQFSSLCNEYL